MSEMRDQPRFEEQVACFERAWRSGAPPEIPPAPAPLRDELVAVDLECRWSCGAPQKHLEHYVKRGVFAALSDISMALIQEEYRCRRRAGDEPLEADYVARFPEHTGLSATLRKVNEELAAEYALPLQAAAAAPPRDRAGELSIHDFRLRRIVGDGGIARVYTAVQKSQSRAVAVKVMRKRHVHLPGAVERFLAEARLMQRFDHPQIVRVHGVGRMPDGGHFMALDLIAGRSLQDRLRSGPFPWSEAARLTASLARVVDRVHHGLVLHADIKPANVLLDQHQLPVLTDFGFAFELPVNEHPSQFELPCGGTPAFMAPEQLAGALEQLGPWTDTYALGAFCVALGTQSPPSAARPLALPLSCPPAVREALRRCLQPAPRDRFATAAELAAALEAAEL